MEHVTGFVHAFIVFVAQTSKAKYATSDPPGVAFRLGSVHERWVPILGPLAADVAPSTKFLRAPTTCHEVAVHIPKDIPGLILEEMRPEDAEIIRANSKVSQTLDYILSRRPFFVCARESGIPGPVAWGTIHPDGSIGAVYVAESHRRRGLAKLIIGKLMERREEMYCRVSWDANMHDRVVELGRWHHTDVLESSSGAAVLFSQLEEWRRGWVCNWLPLKCI